MAANTQGEIRYTALATTYSYRGTSTSTPVIRSISKGTTVTAYGNANNNRWLRIANGSGEWVPMYDASNRPLFKMVYVPPATKVEPTIAAEISEKPATKTSTYYYIGKNWNDGVCIGQVGNQYNTLDSATSAYDKLADKTNLKVYNSDGTKVYPHEASTTSNLEPELIEDESDIDWINLYGATASVAEDYQASIDSLTVKNIKGIMGLPYQWSPLQDPRITDGGGSDVGKKKGIGRVYGDKILSRVPLLLITPGVPDFMGSYSDTQAESLMTKMLQAVGEDSNIDRDGLKSIITRDGKYYNLKFDYASFYNCVDPMCRAASYFLGIQDVEVDGVPLKSYNQNVQNRDELDKFLGTYKGCIPFYINSDTSIQDSFGNDTTQSSLADKINGYSSMANELNYILGSSKAGALYDDLKSTVDTSIEGLGNLTNDLLGGSNLITSISQSLSSILAGGKLIFPEIWSDSSFSRSYDVTVKLVTPDNDKLSWYLNIWVPLAHLMALCLPRQKDVNGYISPFLVRAFYKGLFNVDMGIITNMTVQKGGDGQWTKDGLPTSVEVSFTIKDLYNYMALSDQPSIKNNLMNNITLLDYIGNSCGININETDIMRNLEMYLMVGGVGTAQDKIVNSMFTGMDQWFTNKVASVFGFFN